MTQTHQPDPAPPAGQALPGRRRWLRWVLRALVWGGLALLLGVAGLLGWVLFTEGGTRFAVNRGLNWYRGQIAGQIDIAAVRGTLAADLRLEGVELRDRLGRRLAVLGGLTLRWRPALALDDALRVEEVGLDGVEVHLWPGPGPFGDVLPPSDAASPQPSQEAPPPSSRLGPDLPLAVFIFLRVDGVRVVQHPEGAAHRTLVADLRVSAYAAGRGRRAKVTVARLVADVPAANLLLRQGGFDIGWAEPRLRLSKAVFETGLGTVRIPEIAADLQATRGAADVALRPAQALVDELLPPPLRAGPRAQITAAGGLEALRLAVALRWDSPMTVDLTLEGAVQPAPDLTLTWQIRGVDPHPFVPHLTGALGLDGSVRVRGPPTPLDRLGALRPELLEVDARLRCHDCRLAPAGPLSVQGDARLDRGALTSKVHVQALGAVMELTAETSEPLRGVQAPLTIAWRGRVPSLARVSAALGLEDLSGTVRTTGSCAGAIPDLRCTGRVEADSITAGPAQVQSALVRFSAKPTTEPVAFAVTVEANGVEVQGVPGSLDLELRAKGDPEAIELDVQATRGADRVDLNLIAQPGPPAQVELRRLNGRAVGAAFELLEPSRLVLDPARIEIGDLRLVLDGARLAVDGHFAPQGRSALALSVAEFRLDRLQRFLPGLALAGTAALNLKLRGAAGAPRIDLAVTGRALAFNAKQVGDLDVELSHARHRSVTTIDLRTPGPTAHVEASIPIRLSLDGPPQWLTEGAHRVAWRIEGLTDDWARAWVALPNALDGELSSRGAVEGTVPDPDVHATVDGTVVLPGLGQSRLDVKLDATGANQAVRVELAPPRIRAARIEAMARADLAALQAGADPMKTPFEARVVVPGLPLKQLAEVMPLALHGPVGMLTVDLQVEGTPAAPRGRGRLTIGGGAITVVPINQRLEGIDVAIVLDDRAVRVERFSFHAGDGQGSLSAEVRLAEDLSVDASAAVRLGSYPIGAPGAPPMEIDLGLDVVARRGADGALDAEAKVRDTRVRLLDTAPTRAPKPIPQSQDVVFTDVDAAASAVVEIPDAGPGAPLSLSILLVDPIEIRGAQLDMRWGGAIDVRRGPDGQTVSGGLNAERGTFDLLGNRFELDSGEVSLPQSVGVPYIRIVADTQTARARVTVRIIGPVTSPELTFSSEPPMPQFQILQLLVTGSLGGDENQGQDMQYAAAGLLASFSNPVLERQLQDRVGIDRVELTFGETVDQPILRVGKRLSQRLNVETRYHHNAPLETNTTEALAEILLRRRLSLETRYGDRGVGSIDVVWRARIGSLAPVRVP